MAITDFDTFRNLTPQEAKSTLFKSSYLSNFASRVSQTSSNSFSQEIILENIQSIQSLGFNAIETHLNLLPVPYTIKSKNNGIVQELSTSSNFSLKSHQNHFSGTDSLTRQNSKVSYLTELQYRTGSANDSSTYNSQTRQNYVTFSSGSVACRKGVKKLNLNNLQLDMAKNEEGDEEDLGRITERSKESGTDLDKLNTDRSTRNKMFERSMKLASQKYKVSGSPVVKTELIKDLKSQTLKNGLPQIDATKKGVRSIDQFFNHNTQDSMDYKELRFTAKELKNDPYLSKKLFRIKNDNTDSPDLKNYSSGDGQQFDGLTKHDSDSTRIANQFSSRVSFKSLEQKTKNEKGKLYSTTEHQNDETTERTYGEQTMEVEDLEMTRDKKPVPTAHNFTSFGVHPNKSKSLIQEDSRQSTQLQVEAVKFSSGDTFSYSNMNGFNKTSGYNSGDSVGTHLLLEPRKQSNFTIPETISRIYSSFKHLKEEPVDHNSRYSSHEGVSARELLEFMRKDYNSSAGVGSKDSYRKTKTKILQNILEENNILIEQIAKFEGRVQELTRNIRSKKSTLRTSKNQLIKKRQAFSVLHEDLESLQSKNFDMVNSLSNTLDSLNQINLGNESNSVTLNSKKQANNLDKQRQQVVKSQTRNHSESNKENMINLANQDSSIYSNSDVGNYSFRNSKETTFKHQANVKMKKMDRNHNSSKYSSQLESYSNLNFTNESSVINPKNVSFVGRGRINFTQSSLDSEYLLNDTQDEQTNPIQVTQTFGRQTTNLLNLPSLTQSYDSSEGYLNQWMRSKQAKDRHIQDSKPSDRFPVLKGKLNKSLVEFFLQDDAADESVNFEETSSFLGVI